MQSKTDNIFPTELVELWCTPTSFHSARPGHSLCACLRVAAVLTQTLLGLQFLQPSRTGGAAESNRVAVFKILSHPMTFQINTMLSRTSNM